MGISTLLSYNFLYFLIYFKYYIIKSSNTKNKTCLRHILLFNCTELLVVSKHHNYSHSCTYDG